MKAPTVEGFTQKLLLSLAVSVHNIDTHTTDILKAYIPSKIFLERDVYTQAPEELYVPPLKFLKVIKPLYALPETGLHCYLTNASHHFEILGMIKSQIVPCLLYQHEVGTLSA